MRQIKNVLLIGDNRNRRNFGCRYTSIALVELLSELFPLPANIDTIDGGEISSWTATVVPFGGKGFLWRASLKYRMFRTIFFRFRKRFKFEADYVSRNSKVSMENLLRIGDFYPALSRIINKIRNADVIILNAEGDYIFTTPGRRNMYFFNMIIEFAHQSKTPVFWTNGMFSGDPEGNWNVIDKEISLLQLKKCQGVLCRDSDSEKFLKDHLNCNFVADAAFIWPPSTKRPLFYSAPRERFFGQKLPEKYILITGTSIAPQNLDAAKTSYNALLKSLKESYPVVVLPLCDGDMFLKDVALENGADFVSPDSEIHEILSVISGAELFVTGRYHPAIAAIQSNVPIIMLSGNSHKMQALSQDFTNIKRVFNGIPTNAEISEISELVTTKKYQSVKYDFPDKEAIVSSYKRLLGVD